MRVKLSIACAQNSGPCEAHRSSCKRDRICASADAKATPSINTRFRVTTCRIWSNGAPSYCGRCGNCRVLRMFIALRDLDQEVRQQDTAVKSSERFLNLATER